MSHAPNISCTHTRHGPVSPPTAVDGKLGAPNALNPKFFPISQRAWFYPSELALIYNFPPVSFTNRIVVGVISFGGGLFGTVNSQGVVTNGDVHKLWLEQGILQQNMPLVVISPLFPGNNNVDNNETGENTLDVGVIGGSYPSPNMTIIVYILSSVNQLSDYGGVGQSVFDRSSVTVDGVTYTPNVFSISWSLYSFPERTIAQSIGSGNPDILGAEAKFASVTRSGINICISSGDRGAKNGGTTANLTWPSCSPNVTAVGGTDLVCPTLNYGASSTQETAWSGSGGGPGFFAKPSYQRGGSTVCRSTPDVAMISTPGIGSYIAGNLYTVTGTSLSAPLFATYIAIINPGVFINPLLYQANSSGFHDITTGGNGFNAQLGFDYCTGLGSINGTTLMNFLAVITNIVVVPTNNTMYINDTLQLSSITTPANYQVTWTSSNNYICTVDNNGYVSAVHAGTCTIAASIGNISGSCTIIVNSIEVTGITVNPSSISILLYTITQLSGIITPSNASNQDIIWTSNNIAIATVSSSGLVTGITRGTCVITATSSNNITATCSVSIYAVDVTSITIAPTQVRLLVYNTVQLNYSITPNNASDQSVAWSSSNNNIVTVQDGLVTSHMEGTAEIRVATRYGSYSAVCSITVYNVHVSNITLSQNILDLLYGTTTQLTYTIFPSDAVDQNITWSSSDVTIVTVQDGLVMGLKEGIAHVNITTRDGNYSASCNVTVYKIHVIGITISPNIINLLYGTTAQLSYIISPNTAADQSIVWNSGDDTIVTVHNGLLTPVSEGTTQVTVTTNDGNHSAVCNVTVQYIHVNNIVLTLNALNLPVHTSFNLSYTITPNNAMDQRVVWSSSDITIVTVYNGTITGIQPGVAQITVMTLDGNYISICEVTVQYIEVTALSIIPQKQTIYIHGTTQLNTQIIPNNATDQLVSWFTDNSNTTVSNNGLVTGVTIGSSTIYANLLQYTASCDIIITEYPVTPGVLNVYVVNQTCVVS